MKKGIIILITLLSGLPYLRITQATLLRTATLGIEKTHH